MDRHVSSDSTVGRAASVSLAADMTLGPGSLQVRETTCIPGLIPASRTVDPPGTLPQDYRKEEISPDRAPSPPESAATVEARQAAQAYIKTDKQKNCRHNRTRPRSKLDKYTYTLFCHDRHSPKCKMNDVASCVLDCGICSLRMCYKCWQFRFPQSKSRNGPQDLERRYGKGYQDDGVDTKRKALEMLRDQRRESYFGVEPDRLRLVPKDDDDEDGGVALP